MLQSSECRDGITLTDDIPDCRHVSLVGDSNVAISTTLLYAECVCVLHQAVDKLLFSVVVVFTVVVVVVDIDNDVIQTAGM